MRSVLPPCPCPLLVLTFIFLPFAPAAGAQLVLNPAFAGDLSVLATPVAPAANFTGTLAVYSGCGRDSLPLSTALVLAPGVGGQQVITVTRPLVKGEVVCLEESFQYVPPVPPPIALPPTPQTLLTQELVIERQAGVPFEATGLSSPAFYRLSAGIDVSASASVDPAAKFLLDAAFDAPLLNSHKADRSLEDNQLLARLWGTGYVRLASIAQPGPVAGLADVATYIKPLGLQTPDQLVQSAEGKFSLGWRVTPRDADSISHKKQFTMITLIADAGIITPLSISQDQPVVYIVNQPIYSFYTAAPVPSTAANIAILGACGPTFSTTTPCYLAYIPQDRSRFFRNYAGGVMFKKYYYNGGATAADDSYGFPGFVSLSAGQNEYVTHGKLQGIVLHLSASWPLPAGVGGKWGSALYAYAGLDTHVTRKNDSTTQFLLQTASSTVTSTMSSVALITVPQPDRDRYRFGVGVDLVKLISVIASTTPK